ncbi:Uu.00g119450.m01.CDS01 [Anthostomella pinea]|uniref:Uu.00g119450.m01.CDS01 n=1 Tax=Anthostomella pinea TaxID=933095 RepID=A0AAI8VH46_9PEZI|nr:Uu.00g119450.m01.CDS01 [Anthostomella pinea]
MRPIILHNVPDEELYTGDDGVQRPYAVVWPEGDRSRTAPRTRAREVNESGSFGKSTRRSRSRTGSAPPKRGDATMQSADKVFSSYIASRQQTPIANEPTQRKSSYLSQTAIAPSQDDPAAAAQALAYAKQPVEIILRGYSSPSQQYAAINHYEQLAGRICEDYSREPPIEARRYKSDLRDPALTTRQPLSNEERKRVNKFAGGEHWIKVTFESQEAADSAIYASPQKIMGHLVYAEPYRSLPPLEDAAVLDLMGDVGMLDPTRSNTVRGRGRRPSEGRNKSVTLPRSFSTPGADRNTGTNGQLGSPPDSQTSTQTMDSATISASSATASTATVTGMSVNPNAENELEVANGTLSRRIPTAKRLQLLPAEDALVKQPKWNERLLALVPLLGWFASGVIGNEVPRNEMGDFDMNKASLYWKIMFWLDYWFSLFGRELVSNEKDD